MDIARSIYSPVFKPVAKKIGIHQSITDLYYRVKLWRHPGIERHQIGGTSVRFHIKSVQEYKRFRNLVGERSIIADLQSEIKQDDVFYDVGANVGSYTCFLANHLQPGQVIAFEPHPVNVKALQSNLELNDVSVNIIKQALSDTTGIAELDIASGDAGEGEHALATSEQGETIEVELTTGDYLVAEGEIPSPTVCKIDVEGAELKVLRGLQSSLSNTNCRICYVEIHPNKITKYGDSVEEIYTLLQSSGFDITTLQNRGTQDFIKATKPT